MKEVLSEENIIALVEYRLKRAKNTLLEAEMLGGSDFYNAAVNRLYYACYYAVVALLIKNHISTQTHAGVKRMFNLHFVLSGKIPSSFGRFYSRLFNDRMSGDYDDFVEYDAGMFDEILPEAKELVALIEKEVLF